MSKHFYLGLFFMSVLSYLGMTADARDYPVKKQGRSLASHSPVNAKMGQAEQILHGRSKVSPVFAQDKRASAVDLKIEAACRDSYGMYRSTRQPALYSECLEPMNHSSWASPTSSIVGVRIGK